MIILQVVGSVKTVVHIQDRCKRREENKNMIRHSLVMSGIENMII